MNKETKKLADEISFRLLATNKHPDYKWLCSILSKQTFKRKQFNMKNFLSTWYPIIIAFTAMLYSIGLGVFGYTEEAQYSAHWSGTILLFAIAIRQRRIL